MLTDSDNMPLDPLTRRKRVNFDPTINLGHIMTFVASMAIVATAYFDLRQADAVQEHRIAAIQAEIESEKARTRDTLREMRDDMREVRRGIEDLLRSDSKRLSK
jgi:uncharacterized membrane protein (DUF106 family)